jgi:excisionase family DNA binding protein
MAFGERFLTLCEAAQVLRLSTRTVREYVKRGEIKGKLMGKRWRFRPADLDAFFENAPSEWEFEGNGTNRE